MIWKVLPADVSLYTVCRVQHFLYTVIPGSAGFGLLSEEISSVIFNFKKERFFCSEQLFLLQIEQDLCIYSMFWPFIFKISQDCHLVYKIYPGAMFTARSWVLIQVQYVWIIVPRDLHENYPYFEVYDVPLPMFQGYIVQFWHSLRLIMFVNKAVYFSPTFILSRDKGNCREI